jgi:ABC-type transport system involved in multi-copper enzyme maturation permease subunit
VNPVLHREALDRFRGRRAWPFLLLWILGNLAAVYLLLLLGAEVSNQGFGGLLGRPSVGPFVFHGALVLLLVGIVMIMPGLAAVTIVGEREKQTLRLVQVTTLSPLQIVTGKLGASLGYIGWLVAAVLPVLAAPLLLGGVGLGDAFGALVMLFLIAATIGSMSIWLSARAKSTRAAVAGSYMLTFLMLFATPLVAVGEGFLKTDRFREVLEGDLYSLVPNPYLALGAAVLHPLELGQEATAFSPAQFYLIGRETGDNGFDNVNRDLVVERDGHEFVRLTRPPFWVLSALFYLVLSTLAIRRATRWVTTPSQNEFMVKRRNQRN